MPSPPAPDDGTGDRKRDWLVDLPLIAPDLSGLPGRSSVADVRSAVEGLVDDARPDPAAIENALAGVDAPALADADVSVTALSGDGGVDPANADGVVEAGGEAVAVAVESGGDAASVVLDAGGDAVEVVVENGGDEAAEVTLEVVAAALDGL